jgi:hypothetical protein
MVTKSLYASPLGGRIPALEQNIIQYRAMEMVLALFYAEDLRKSIIGCVRTTDRFLRDEGSRARERIPPEAKNPLKKALNALKADGIINEKEKAEIKELIDYRNEIAHRLENLNADISHIRFVKDMIRLGASRRPKYNYQAVERLSYYRNLISERTSGKYVQMLSMAPLVFETTEITLKSGLKRLSRKIERQLAIRKQEITKLNTEFSLEGTGLTDELHPRHPYNKHDSGKLTSRGIEVCYRLFDIGKSSLAVAHIMQVSLATARRREKMWRQEGGKKRPQKDVNSMQIRRFYRTDDD